MKQETIARIRSRRTGTGNSLFAAKSIASEGEDVISMVDAVRSKAFHYTLKENEPFGFVFPVYFYTVSDPVPELVRNLTVENAGFVYAVIPCGASIGAAPEKYIRSCRMM